jgi:hypothetical protein
MEKVSYVLGGEVRVHFRSVGGDLRLSGQGGDVGEIQVAQRGGLTVNRAGDSLEITTSSGCLAFMPAKARVTVDHVGGDARLTGMEGALVVGTVGGDLSLRRDAEVQVEWIGGDLDLRALSGSCLVKTCGGDARIAQLEGSLAIDQLGGDIVLREVQGNVNTRLGGSAKLQLFGRAEAHDNVQAGGDLACGLPPDADVRLRLAAGGDLRLSGLPDPEPSEGEGIIVLGDGTGTIRLQAGGDLWVTKEVDGLGAQVEDLPGLVAARIQSKMAGLEAKWRAKADRSPEFEAERIEEQVRRAVSRSLQHRGWGEDQSSIRGRTPSWLGIGNPEGRKSQERLRILRMLEQKRISLEEAELLMDALESEG